MEEVENKMKKRIVISILMLTGLVIGSVVAYRLYQDSVVLILDHGSRITSASFSTDGNYVITRDYKGIEKIWEVKNGREVKDSKSVQVSKKSIFQNGERKLFSSDGKRVLAVGDWNTNAKLLDENGNLIAELGQVHWADFSADNKRLVTLESKRHSLTQITFWDRDGRKLNSFKAYEYSHNFAYAQPSGIYDTVKFNFDGSQILTVGCDTMGVSGFDVGRCILGSARLWDTKGNLLKEFFKGGAVDYADYSQDGSWIVAAGCDKYAIGFLGINVCDANRVRIYKSDGELITTMNESALIATFSPDKTRLLTVDYDTAKLWKIGK